MEDLIREFTNDPMVQTMAVLVVIDIVLGISAAVVGKSQTFQLSYVVDFLRNDVLGKLVPYYAVWAGVHLGGDFEVIGIPAIESVVGAAVIAALGASILNSLRDLGFWKSAPNELAGPDPGTPG